MGKCDLLIKNPPFFLTAATTVAKAAKEAEERARREAEEQAEREAEAKAAGSQ